MGRPARIDRNAVIPPPSNARQRPIASRSSSVELSLAAPARQVEVITPSARVTLLAIAPSPTRSRHTLTHTTPTTHVSQAAASEGGRVIRKPGIRAGGVRFDRRPAGVEASCCCWLAGACETSSNNKHRVAGDPGRRSGKRWRQAAGP